MDTPASPRHAGMWGRGLLAAGTLAVAAVGASFQTHSWPSTVTVLSAAAVMLAIALRRPVLESAWTPRLRRGLVLWSAAVIVGLAWEAYAFVRQPDWSLADPAHPTLSTLFDPVLEQGPLRIVGWLMWLGIGWRLVAR